MKLRSALVVVLAIGTMLWPAHSRAAGVGPVARILAPASGSKIRAGQPTGVTIHIDGSPQLAWVLALQGPGRPGTVLASGSGPVSTGTVAEINPDTLEAGNSYTLSLIASDGGATARASAIFSIPDPQYTLIPLQEGNLSVTAYGTYAVDSSGDQVLYSPTTGDPAPFTVIHRQTGRRDQLLLRLANTTGVKFSGDGTHLFYTGTFPYQGGFIVAGLGYRDLGSGADALLVDQSVPPFFSVDDTGRRVAFQEGLSNDTTQYFLYDQPTNSTRQLTSDPAAINLNADCTGVLGTTPLITADGGTVILITPATLGIVPADPSTGCRVFAYDVAAQSFRQVAALPQSLTSIIPALSADGRWLSFVAIEAFPGGSSHGVPGLLDAQTGALSVPVVDVGSYTSFDSDVTPDGGGIVISTEADLDPRVGNADHNLELFYYDRASGHFTQISETLAGIGRTPNGCPPYLPGISHDGGVLVFAFLRSSGEGCVVDGPQRNEADGFLFDFVRAVRKRPGNAPPAFAAVPDQRVVAGQTLTLNFIAQDPDGDPISFFAQLKDGQDVPPGSTITDHHDGTATFQWRTTPDAVGDYVLRVAAFDEGGDEVYHDVTISIVPSGSDCVGDCNGDGRVTIAEILTGISAALGKVPPTACPAFGSGQVGVSQLLAAVGNALNGCPSPPKAATA